MTGHDDRSLEREVADVVLETAREWVKSWNLEDGEPVRATWHSDGTMTLKSYDTGHAADFRVRVIARQLSDAGEVEPEDLVVGVIEAARRLTTQPGYGLASLFGDPEQQLLGALAALDAALAAGQREEEPEGEWEPGSWREVKDGDRVRLKVAAGYAEATVVSASRITWIGSGASQVQVVLSVRPEPYAMPPSGQVEIWRARLPQWAAGAFQALMDAGLEPEFRS